LADFVTKVFFGSQYKFSELFGAAIECGKAARSRQAGLRHDGRIEGLFFAPLARVLSFIADNRDTQGIHVATRLACNQRRRNHPSLVSFVTLT
jgi:hypothetical protein